MKEHCIEEFQRSGDISDELADQLNNLLCDCVNGRCKEGQCFFNVNNLLDINHTHRCIPSKSVFNLNVSDSHKMSDLTSYYILI